MRMLHAKFLATGALWFLISPIAWAQQPVITNTAVKPGAGGGLPRQAPRGTVFAHQIRQVGTVDTPANNIPLLLMEDAQNHGGPMRNGVVHAVNIDSRREGIWMPLNDGWLWTVRIVAPGAKAMRIAVDPWSPPSGAELIVYNVMDETETYGPFTGVSPAVKEFWSPIIYSSELHVEYFLPAH